MASSTPQPAESKRVKPRRSFAVVGLAPFFTWALLFLILPAVAVLVRALKTPEGSLTTKNIKELFAPQYRAAFRTSISISLLTALVGAAVGTAVAYSALTLKRPKWLRSVVMTFSGLAAQFGGVALAFMFIATLGALGIVTTFLKNVGFNLYGTGFRVYSFTGLVIVYTYFQIPLMIIVIAPAIDGLRQQWREAATNLGASTFQYWRHVAIPVLMPSLLGGLLLLFANSFSAYATAAALTSGQVNLVPIQIAGFLNGNVVADNPQMGQALAGAMVVIIVVVMLVYSRLQKRAARWSK
jgi:putative spermidine/putrescine transport system permease protein